MCSCCCHELQPSARPHASRGRQPRSILSSASATITCACSAVRRAGESIDAQLDVDGLAWLKLHPPSLLDRQAGLGAGGSSGRRSHEAGSAPKMAPAAVWAPGWACVASGRMSCRSCATSMAAASGCPQLKSSSSAAITCMGEHGCTWGGHTRVHRVSGVRVGRFAAA